MGGLASFEVYILVTFFEKKNQNIHNAVWRFFLFSLFAHKISFHLSCKLDNLHGGPELIFWGKTTKKKKKKKKKKKNNQMSSGDF